MVENLCSVDSLKDEFKTALEAMVNYELVSIGIPPTLPNFDELTETGMDYLTKKAMEEAGITDNEITEAVVDKVSESIKKEMKSSAERTAPNPINAEFLKLAPDYLYRPAYVDIEIRNDSNVKTVAGIFNLNITFEFDYSNMYSNNYAPYAGILISSDSREHFLHGLNGNTLDFLYKGDVAVYDIFTPIMGMYVPVLQPHETMNLRIYIKPFTDSGYSNFPRYPSGEAVLKYDFEVMYFFNGNKKFTNFYLFGHFPEAE